MFEKENYSSSLERIFDIVFWAVLFPFVSCSFILTDLTNDSRIFIAAEAIADKYYPLPYGWDAAYEVKPIGNRLINWVFYKVGNFFSPFVLNNYGYFGMWVKLTALIILVACCWYISRRIKFPYAFPFLFVSFACMANFGIMMSEWFAALFSLVAIALCFEKNKNWMIVAGALCVYIAILKGITAFLVIAVVCAVFLLGGSIDWKRAIAGYVAAGLACVALWQTVWPHMISDILLSRLIAHIGMYDPITLMQWFWMTQDRSNLIQVLAYYSPALLIGMLAGVFVVSRYLFKKDYTKVLLFIGMWGIPIGTVFAQSEFIIYHYLVLMVPAMVSVAILTERIKAGWKLIAAAIVGLIIGYLLITCAFGVFNLYEYSFWHQKEMNANSINEQFNLSNQSTLLYLDPGDASFYFHANSSCRYIAPMPVERSTAKWNITYLPSFTETYNCIMDYQGKYIVADVQGGMVTGYYGEGILIRKPITDMLKNNYSIVDNESWTIYQKKNVTGVSGN